MSAGKIEFSLADQIDEIVGSIKSPKRPTAPQSHKPKIELKRHTRKPTTGNIKGVTKAAIRRLARRGGVKRIDRLIYEDTRDVLVPRLTKWINDAILLTQSKRLKTVTQEAVLYSLARNNAKLYSAK